MFTFTLMTTETSSQNINKSRPILHWLQDLFSLDTCTDIITYLLQRGNITVTSISGSGGSASTIDCAEWSRFSIFDINSDCTDFNSLTSSSEPWKEEMLGEAINPQMNKESVVIDIHHPEHQRQWQYHQLENMIEYPCDGYTQILDAWDTPCRYSKAHLFCSLNVSVIITINNAGLNWLYVSARWRKAVI